MKSFHGKAQEKSVIIPVICCICFLKVSPFQVQESLKSQYANILPVKVINTS